MAITQAPGTDPRPAETAAATTRLDELVRRARANLVWELVWRGFMPPLLVLGAFVLVSFAGVWLVLPPRGRLLGCIAFALIFLSACLPMLKWRWPTRRQALERIEQVSGLDHHPALVLEDRLANPGQDPATEVLWALHRRRAATAIAAMRTGWPAPRLVERDPYALRALVLVGLVATGFIAGPQKYARVAAAFDWGLAAPSAIPSRLDAWIDPPPYTGRAPILLTAGDPRPGPKLEVPVGSTLIIRSAGWGAAFELKGAAVEVSEPDKANLGETERLAPHEASAGDEREKRFTLNGDATLSLQHGGLSRGTFQLIALPDKPPRITLAEVPRVNARGSLTLGYRISDDYGVASAEAEFTEPRLDGEHGPIRSLVDPPKMPLLLPTAPGGLGDAETTGDLSDHPWAGARVKMVLKAHDEGGNEGQSPPLELILPQKPFLNPLAAALVEQRRDLVLMPSERAKVMTALESLMIAPDAFGMPPAPYLGLRVAIDWLQGARTDADLLEVADYLWEMALRIENGDLNDAERDLRAAEQQLREALERHAPPEEIEKRTEALRRAMETFLGELARLQQSEEGGQQAKVDPRAQKIAPKDLQAMLDHMREAARSGDQAEAQKMLDRLRNILDNLRMGRRAKPDPHAAEANRSIDALNKMSREQQDLRDDTYRGNDEMSLQDFENFDEKNKKGRNAGEEELQRRQQQLRQRLDEVQKRLKQTGQGEKSLDDAEQAMKEAEDALGQGPDGREDAADAQGRALQSMRQGAEKLAESLQRRQGEQGSGEGEAEGQAEGEEEGPSNQGRRGSSDPLGRPTAGNPVFNPGAKFDPLGVPAAQRAQQVLEELRRRLSDPHRPREETDYLERLLRPF
ncbi:TIGR02302 family protein [Beijerinckia indica]|uniref:TIGR02302 family protein n=1 Tax=Beijerinckia indica subsp. indica (strain ATCC 9039 / DSM 1715 / NCIMB 8712) TaxID=395963 RepID=B2IB10_BEII9|nr:TIGR02302 family protein [Beijerinckia indica]ACB93710.1 conserved hypothetical protein [Beijerinckia indica subsp. indica ATCC 9039]